MGWGRGLLEGEGLFEKGGLNRGFTVIFIYFAFAFFQKPFKVDVIDQLTVVT